jgi:hypothetical protein
MFLASKARPVLRVDNLTADCLDNMRASMCLNPVGLHGLLLEELCLYNDSCVVSNVSTSNWNGLSKRSV